MKRIKYYYADIPNMGDQLNRLIAHNLFGLDIKHCTYLNGQISGIGSGLGQFTLHGNVFMRACERMSGIIFPDVKIWGSGFYYYREKDEPFYRKNIEFCAVRGELSKKRVEKLLGKELNIPTADGGILAPYLIKKPVAKKYEIGIIPHITDFKYERAFFENMAESYPESILINVSDDPIVVVHQIAECRVILSSSLHGLIVADAFHIPNRHMRVTQKMGGDGFKFDDYYSAYGMKHEFTDVTKQELPTVNDILKNYQVPYEIVEKKKQQMIDCFPLKGNKA